MKDAFRQNKSLQHLTYREMEVAKLRGKGYSCDRILSNVSMKMKMELGKVNGEETTGDFSKLENKYQSLFSEPGEEATAK